jgi:membrane-bound metal-dependent hydrolase YbcI (DUF457 family)
MYILFLKEITFDYFFLACFFVILPDLDIFIMPLKRVFKSNYFEHRSGSHSYIIGVIISAIIGIVYSILMQKPFIFVWITGIVFYGIHVSQDLLTTTEIPYLYPISKKELCFYVEKAGSSFTLLITWIFLLLLYFISTTSPEISIFILLIDIFTYFFIFYYMFRIITKIWVSSRLIDNQKYFPGVLPIFYIIFTKTLTQDEVSISIEKRSHFFRNKLILEYKYVLSPEEMEMFNKGISICNKTYYYAKWTVIPTILRKEGIFSVRFFFLEPMVKTRAMYNQYDFDLNSQKVIDHKQSYGRIKP